jgi:predicted nucleic acid-binding Zn ribbon protein
MKKISITFCITLLAIYTQAQDQVKENFEALRDRDFMFDTLHICATIAVIYLVSYFILHTIKNAMTFRLKHRMLDKGTEENIVRELLQPDKKENKNYILQWFFILASMGVGLILVKLIQPFGLHSLAILALSIAAGFGAYYYFSRER